MKQRSLLTIVALLCLHCGGADVPSSTTNANARSEGPPLATRPALLWEIEREGRPSSYLHGSVHVLAAGQQTVGQDAIDAAYAGADALVVEVDVQDLDAAALQATVVELGTYPPEDSAENHMPAALWARVLERCGQLGVAPEGAQRMRPWLLSITLTTLSLQREGYSQESGVDQSFLTRAHEAGRPVISLETAEGQLQAMAGLPDETQAVLMEQTLMQLGEDDTTEELFEAWLQGDGPRLAEVMFRDLEEHPELSPAFEALFFARNRQMAERLEALLAEDQSLFVVVGAGHLVGEGSIVSLLRERGLQVTQVQVPDL